MRKEFLNKLFNFVILTSKMFNIDESHSITHSMNVYYYANNIYDMEDKKQFSNSTSNLTSYKNIIDVASIIHDMCDKKYMDEKLGLERIDNFIKLELKDEINNEELDVIKKIISTMSYSTVEKKGFPILNEYQLAYNIVREADLLTSYDFDRCIIYNMMKNNNNNYFESFDDALNLFENRVFKYHEKNLFVTKYGLKESYILKNNAINRIKTLKNFIKYRYE
jgi:hypothetical protein